MSSVRMRPVFLRVQAAGELVGIQAERTCQADLTCDISSAVLIAGVVEFPEGPLLSRTFRTQGHNFRATAKICYVSVNKSELTAVHVFSL